MPSQRSASGTEPSQRTLAVVMAGGNGTRLGELTRWHSKPALPFAGQYRNIDFTLSNCVNSGVRRIALATQYKAHSLIQHVQRGWSFLRPEVGEFVEVWPAQQRTGGDWYSGTADAIFQNIDLVEAYAPDYVLILAGDHVYKMDYRSMLDDHAVSGADVTVGCIEVPIEGASAFGVMQVDSLSRVTRFDEKPGAPVPSPRDPRFALASMGIYVFNRDVLVECLREDAKNRTSRHDFGRNIIPSLVGQARLHAHAFTDPRSGGPGYWRDVGTIDSYWQANMDLLEDNPRVDLYDATWPICTYSSQGPPPTFVGAGTATRSIVSVGCRIAGTVEHSVLSQGCSIGPGSMVESTVVLPDVTIGRDCRISKAIIESGCRVPDGVTLGGDASDDQSYVSEGGVVLITRADIERAAARRAQPKVAYLTAVS